MKLLRIAILTLCAISSGCVYTAYTGKDGVSMKRISLFGNQSAARVDLLNGTIDGYTSEQAQIAGAVAGEVAKALVKP
jgi:hypothetical protein